MARKASVIKANGKLKFAVRRKNRCQLCGRSRSYIRRFGLCRLCFRELAHKGELPGVVRATW